MDEAALDNIGKALAKIPSGCAILTAADGDNRTGMLASWIQQAAFDPPAVTVAVKKGRPIEPLIASSGRFVLNVIGEDKGPLFRHFANGFGPGEEAFEGLDIDVLPAGIGLKNAVAVLSAETAGQLDAGDHTIYLGRIVAGRAEDGARPYVHARKSGLTY